MLFNEIVYGPIHSRRLGVSLGMNLMPADAKLCTFDCVYCECGFNQPVRHPHLPSAQEVCDALEAKLRQLCQTNVKPDVITFSGNGEPTLHPDFLRIIQDTCRLRDQYCPTAKVSVLSNSTQLHRADVIQALRQVDNRIMKLDSAFNHTMRRIDQPVSDDFCIDRLIAHLQQFEGDLIVQTCFLRGTWQGETFDNTTPEEVTAWLDAVRRINPRELMIYVIDRATPVKTLEKISREEMEQIAEQARRQLHIPVQVSA
ncbi:MAG: radical SAM protein [Paludibacteraceae bacterium]|nr:radical SAM protein [Paludibacteraceae bacterium]